MTRKTTPVSSSARRGKKELSLKEIIARRYQIVSEDLWYGFKRCKFIFQGFTAWVVEPQCSPFPGNPWTWTMQWAEAFVDRTGVLDLLKIGFRHVTLELFDTRMDEKGIAAAAAFQKFLVGRLRFAPRANLVGMSWGGFFSVRYAAARPRNVRKIYLDAPLLNFDGAFIQGNTPTNAAARIGSWEKSRPADGKWSNDPRMPLNKTKILARERIPLLLLYGGQDQTVPPQFNSEPFIEGVQDAGGKITVIKRDLFGHHPHGVDPDKTALITRFFLE